MLYRDLTTKESAVAEGEEGSPAPQRKRRGAPQVKSSEAYEVDCKAISSTPCREHRTGQLAIPLPVKTRSDVPSTR